MIDEYIIGNEKMTSLNIETDILLRDNSRAHRNKRELAASAGQKTSTICNPFSYRFWKNVIDRVLALSAIVILSPLLGIIALAIKLDSRGSILFPREQVGEKGKKFTALKFRTMHTDNDDAEYKQYLVRYVLENAPYKINPDGQAIYKVVDDPRVTRFGSLLRKSNLDELPQLINILKGEMSFVGPRPDVPFAVSMYQAWHLKRLNAKPGITGLWQVCSRKELPFEGMVRLDISYIKRQSLLLDIKIMLLTVGTILRGDGS
jgi:lipopolysaccharide/colanic/teichoic acid biosynthesis glycosyltransferase